MSKTLLPNLRIAFVFVASVIAGLFLLFKIKGILLPFILSFIFAYCFDGLVCRLAKKNISRQVSSLVIVLVVFGSAFVAVSLLAPVLYSQFKSLVLKLPFYIEQFDTRFIPSLQSKLSSISGKDIQLDGLNQSIRDKLSLYAQNFGANLLSGIVESGKKIIALVSMIFLTPILCFYLLKDFNHVSANFVKLIPNRYKDSVSSISNDIKSGISSYLSGQIYLICILSLLYTTGLMLVGLDYAFLIGFCTGLFAIIPYLGFFIWLVVGCVIAAFQYGEVVMVIATLSVFLTVQVIDAAFLTPTIMSSKIGVNPIWIIFSMLMFSVLFGFFGVFFAMPLTVITATLIKFATKVYFASDYYQNHKHSA
jgi:predicted PurR-regulated permease PerM